jgi:hypothetical protein
LTRTGRSARLTAVDGDQGGSRLLGFSSIPEPEFPPEAWFSVFIAPVAEPGQYKRQAWLLL